MLNRIKIKNSTFNYEIHNFINDNETKETLVQGDQSHKKVSMQ